MVSSRRCRYIAVAHFVTCGEEKLGIYMQLAKMVKCGGTGWDAGNGRSDWSDMYVGCMLH